MQDTFLCAFFTLPFVTKGDGRDKGRWPWQKAMAVTKGDDRDNGDSRRKLKLGQTWAAQAGRKYRYFMTFDQNSIEGAYNLEDFADVLRDL